MEIGLHLMALAKVYSPRTRVVVVVVVVVADGATIWMGAARGGTGEGTAPNCVAA